jgi:hypothetical protein
MSDSPPKADRALLNLQRYQARLGFWQAIWGTLITGGIAVAIPAGVDAYKASLEVAKTKEEEKLKEKEIALKDKELEGDSQSISLRYLTRVIGRGGSNFANAWRSAEMALGTQLTRKKSNLSEFGPAESFSAWMSN